MCVNTSIQQSIEGLVGQSGLFNEATQGFEKVYLSGKKGQLFLAGCFLPVNQTSGFDLWPGRPCPVQQSLD